MLASPSFQTQTLEHLSGSLPFHFPLLHTVKSPNSADSSLESISSPHFSFHPVRTPYHYETSLTLSLLSYDLSTPARLWESPNSAACDLKVVRGPKTKPTALPAQTGLPVFHFAPGISLLTPPCSLLLGARNSKSVNVNCWPSKQPVTTQWMCEVGHGNSEKDAITLTSQTRVQKGETQRSGCSNRSLTGTGACLPALRGPAGAAPALSQVRSRGACSRGRGSGARPRGRQPGTGRTEKSVSKRDLGNQGGAGFR